MLEASFHKDIIEAGCDEAGRGCLAGPVVAAAVILPSSFSHPLLNDSKKLSEKTRDELRGIIQKEAVAWSVAEVDADEIDRINILNASIKAMNIAVRNLKVRPEFILVDGNRFYNETGIDFKCVVGGDGIYANIAAASILAKAYRDEKMRKLSEQYPQYGWKNNKGYPTLHHRNSIIQYGLTPLHRKTFGPCLDQLSLF